MQRALQKDVDDEWILGCTCDHWPCRVCKRGSCYVLLGVMPAGERGGDSCLHLDLYANSWSKQKSVFCPVFGAILVRLCIGVADDLDTLSEATELLRTGRNERDAAEAGQRKE